MSTARSCCISGNLPRKTEVVSVRLFSFLEATRSQVRLFLT